MSTFCFCICIHCYKSWGLIPPAWLDDTILNLQANGIYFRHVSWVKTSSLSDFSVGIGHFRWYRTFPKIPPPPLLATKWHLYFMHVMGHTHRWFELVLLCTVCCAPTSVPLVLIELDLIVIYYVSERNCSMFILNAEFAHWAHSCEDMEMGLSKYLLMNYWFMNGLLYKRKRNAKKKWHSATKPLNKMYNNSFN
jgi:hypothetical protein